MPLPSILQKYRRTAFSTEDLGSRFERLMQAYLLTDPKYAVLFKNVWLWNEFFAKDHLGGHDTGIDIVCQTFEGDSWAVQCKCFQEDSYIDKPALDTFLATSSRKFNLSSTPPQNGEGQGVGFSHRLWISTNYYITQMRFPAKGKKDKIIYNSRIYLENIPAEAYGYIVNGKSAIEWIMERYAVATHKDSGITINLNDWARENRNPRYIIDLLHSVINLSVQTVGIVKNLPDVEFGS